VSEATLHPLLGAVRRSWFSQGNICVGDVRLEFTRADGRMGGAGTASPATGPQTPQAAVVPSAAVTTVQAPAPGLIDLAVAGGADVARGDVLGHVQVHRKRVPVVAPISGRVREVVVTDGTFVAYGDSLCVLTATPETATSETASPRAQENLASDPLGQDGAIS